MNGLVCRRARGGRSRSGSVPVHLLAAVVIAVVAAGSLSCEESAHRDIQDEINILTKRNDALVPPATERLARFGRIAIPQIETALHTAAPTGRLHLIDALERLGDADAVPVLRHFAVYDVRAEVRQASRDVLSRWTDASSTQQQRAERAGAAEREIARKHDAGEGPLVFDGGPPGVPTVGAPEPVGIDLEKRQ